MKKSFYKKDYLAGLRCSKNLYLQEHNPELVEIDNNALSIMTMGRDFELTVRNLIAPGGLDLTFVCSTEEELIARTRTELQKENVTLYQPTFQNDTGDTAMIDILIKKGNHIHLIEIKMVTKLEDVHYYDSTFQSYVASTSGFKIDKVSVAYINKNYLREGALTADFMILEDITKPSKKLTVQLPQKVERFKSILKRKEVPEKSIGVYCMEPHTCQFKNHCFEQLPTNNIFELKSIRLSRKLGLYYKGINTIEQLADKERNLTDRQRIHVVCAVENQKAIQWDAIENWFKPLKKAKGIYFMDFETIAPSIPLDDGYKSKPFTQIPFQYSCHYLDKKTQQLTHMDFLAHPGSDYRKNFIKGLLLDINLFDEDAPVLVYNKTFEKTRLKELAELFPEFENDIQAVINRLVDMMDVFRSWYYHPAFKGGFSIKIVLPTLCPDLDYSDLEIKNGSFAASEFMRLQNIKGEEAYNLKHALREYCKRDTYAMVRLLEQLEKEYYEYINEKETLKQVI